MFVVYALCCAFALCCLDLIFIKVYQLENYRILNYIKKIFNFEFAFGKKNKLVFTKRVKRLIFVDFLLIFLYFLLFFLLIKNHLTNIFIFFGFIIFSPYLIIFTFLFALPFEELIKKFYIRKAQNKLKKSMCKKIAITGSFGKTSTKNILYQILKEQFDVCATPKSFNTPMGVCKAILENLKETDDFFVVEYGARHIGDIRFLAKHFGVDFGIITPIGDCHLETFGSVENIEKAKFELCESAKDIVVFNGKSKSTKKLYEKYKHKKYLVCEQNSFAYAKNINTSEEGSQFVLVIDGKEISCQTKLLGKANIDNIVVASSMAYLLEEDLFNIRRAIEKLKPTAHRLELIKGFVDVIDDSYNSNSTGFRQALEVLTGFKGRKIVVSPGIVELGKQQFDTNKEIGREVGKVCDVFVIMNMTNQKALLEGAVEAGLQNEQIYFANTRTEQKDVLKKIVQKGDVVLFENDFPDNIR